MQNRKDKFLAFVESMATSSNNTLIEAVKKGLSVYMESQSVRLKSLFENVDELRALSPEDRKAKLAIITNDLQKMLRQGVIDESMYKRYMNSDTIRVLLGKPTIDDEKNFREIDGANKIADNNPLNV